MGEWLTDHDNERAGRRIKGLIRRKSQKKVAKAVNAYAENATLAARLLDQQFPERPNSQKGHPATAPQPS